MFAQLSHELNPLNGVMGFAHCSSERNSALEQQAHVSHQVCGESMLHIANGVLDFSRLEAQSAELEARAYDAVVLMNEVVGVLEPGGAEGPGAEHPCRWRSLCRWWAMPCACARS